MLNSDFIKLRTYTTIEFSELFKLIDELRQIICKCNSP